MLLTHKKEKPKISVSSRIAPNAVICGDVTIGSNCSIGFGCVLVAESGPIFIGDNCIVMDTAVLRGVRDASLTIGNNVLIGPRARAVPLKMTCFWRLVPPCSIKRESARVARCGSMALFI